MQSTYASFSLSGRNGEASYKAGEALWGVEGGGILLAALWITTWTRSLRAIFRPSTTALTSDWSGESVVVGVDLPSLVVVWSRMSSDHLISCESAWCTRFVADIKEELCSPDGGETFPNVVRILNTISRTTEAEPGTNSRVFFTTTSS